jgi:ribosomal protein S16
VDFIENLGGTLESTDGCIDESAYVSTQQIKNWIETGIKFSDDVLQKGR